MDLTDLIGPDDISVDHKTSCKKQLLQDMAESAARKTGLNSREIFDTLLEREKLGSTGIGNGIAIPHGKIAGLDAITGVAVFLDNPIDFEAIDDQPVDTVFMILAPEAAGADHLKALARVARILREPEMRDRLRNADSKEGIYNLLSGAETPHAA